MSDFPVLDAPRLYADNMLDRRIAGDFGCVEPYMAELDTWIAMPLRLVHDGGAGWNLELGPYSLNAADMHKLREAIAAYDQAVGASR
ncbi:hypothetical protein A5621_00860 [Mycobacterium colombiense]|uniref:hypothetical protein n=1 Tax=Mycobacterium colombiense TaxID=339268 RepID=UPI0007FFCAC3|nr:hypothetical protein [Mycobacterium colombiense]OBJ43110.1 hypothetical protein A5621_00860 [Mycobacterium colombiense]